MVSKCHDVLLSKPVGPGVEKYSLLDTYVVLSYNLAIKPTSFYICSDICSFNPQEKGFRIA